MENNGITGSTLILVDGDVSLERTQYLIELNIEEERLDFKENLHPNEKGKLSKKSKIDLVSDVISFANTYGGYMIFGIKEINSSFTVSGLNDLTSKYLNSENICTLVSNYVNKCPSIKVQKHQINSNTVAILFIEKLSIPVPFSIDGQYINNGKEKMKFKSGDINFRHSSQSEKGNYEDIKDWSERIRRDERIKNSRSDNVEGVITRLDNIIQLLGGNPPKMETKDIFELDFTEIEDYTFNLLEFRKRPNLVFRFIRKIFKEVSIEIKQLEEIEDDESFNTTLNRVVDEKLLKLLPVWEVLNESDEFIDPFISRFNELYLNTFFLKGVFNVKPSKKLFVQKELIQIVYLFGVISLNRKNIESLTNIVERKGSNEEFHYEEIYWFRYVLTMLSRAQMLQHPSLVFLTFENHKENKYLLEILEDKETLLKLINQVDYFQCLRTLVNGLSKNNCYPSFKLYDQRFIEEFLNFYLFYNSWTEPYKTKLANAIVELDSYEMQGYFSWGVGWNHKVQNFINENKK